MYRTHHKYEGKTPAYSLVAKNESVKAERTADTPQKLRVRQREGDRAQHTWHAAPAGCCRKEGRASWESGGVNVRYYFGSPLLVNIAGLFHLIYELSMQ